MYAGMIGKELSLQVLHQISECDVALSDHGCVMVLGMIGGSVMSFPSLFLSHHNAYV